MDSLVRHSKAWMVQHRQMLVLSILLTGGILRLALAIHYGPDGDLGIIAVWAKAAGRLSLPETYVRYHPTYPPFLMEMFGMSYRLHAVFGSHQPLWWYLKIPACAADLFTCLILERTLRFMQRPASGLAAATVYALHPAVLYNSAMWGQADSVHAFFLVASIALCLEERWMAFGACAVLALFSKPQAIALAPLLAFLLLPDRGRLWRALLGGSIVCALLLWPFLSSHNLPLVWKSYTAAIGMFRSVSMNAFNVWIVLFGKSAMHTSDTRLLFGVVQLRIIGYALFFGATVFAIGSLGPQLHRDRSDSLALWQAAGFLSIAFFMLPTEMHERYFFSFLPLALPAAFLSKRSAALYAGFSLTLFCNLVTIRPFDHLDRLITWLPHFQSWLAWINLVLFALLAADILLSARRHFSHTASLSNPLSGAAFAGAFLS